MKTGLHIFPIPGIPEIRPLDDLAEIILEAACLAGLKLAKGDVVVVAQKVVSKAEGRVYDSSEIEASAAAKQLSEYTSHTPEYMELVLRNSRRIVRMAKGIVISQTPHGFVLANSGVDSSNAGGEGRMVALPEDPDKSAYRLQQRLTELAGIKAAVLISDTFGRPWRNGQVNMAIGIAGMSPFIDYRGQKDDDGREMKATVIAAADELCSAAELVSGKTNRYPVVIIRNYRFPRGAGSVKEIIRDEEHDIFK